MSIKDKRIKEEIDRIIKSNLQEGYLPTSNEVISELGNYISTKDLSMPNYKFMKVYSDFSIDTIKKAQEDIYDDSSIIFQCIGDLNSKMKKQISKFEREKKKYQYRFNKLQGELLNLTSKYSTNNYIDSYIESFSDMENIDIQKTDASIDINSKEVSLKRMKEKSYGDISLSHINLEGHYKAYYDEDLIRKMEERGIYWKADLRTKAQKQTSVEIVLDLGKEVRANKVEIEAPMIKPVDMEIQTSKDGAEWGVKYKGTISSILNANISGSSRYIKIRMSKTEADKFIDEEYSYIYLIDTLSIYTVNYANTSILVTKPIKMDSNVNKVSLIADEEVNSGSNITYYVALNQDNLEWVEINPLNRSDGNADKVVSFSTTEMVEGKNIFVDTSVSKKEYKMDDISVNGQAIYNITPNGLTQSNIVTNKVFKGVDSWKEELLTTYVDGVAGKEVFIENQASSASYQKINSYRNGLIMDSREFTQTCVAKYGTTLECPDNDRVVKARVLSNYPITLYLNGEVIFAGYPIEGYDVNYFLKNGKNRIEVVVNINSINDLGKAVAHLDLGIDMKSYSKYIYAEQDPMQEVSLFNLKYNTNNRKDVYALEKGNNGYNLLVKDDDLSIGYIVSYEYIIQDIDEILVSAVLTKNYEYIDISPKIRRLEVRTL